MCITLLTYHVKYILLKKPHKWINIDLILWSDLNFLIVKVDSELKLTLLVCLTDDSQMID